MKLLISGKKYIDQIGLKRAGYESLINRINSSHMTIHGAVGRWSVKEIIAYIQLCELYLADRINIIVSDHNLDRELLDGHRSGLLFMDDHADMRAQFGSDTASLHWRIKKYYRIPLEDLVGLENMAYLCLISLLEMNEEQLMTQKWLYKEIHNFISNIYDYSSTSIEKWLALIQ